ncbi:MAG: PD-(D/E)XK nuclease family protein [Candidatus Heimdallarchaeota archaeon]
MRELNISKTEFIAYLECPFKFYLIKDLNKNKPYGPRGERDYSPFSEESKEGMKWHKWFEKFFDTYKEDIDTRLPPKGKDEAETLIMRRFFQQEKQRCKTNQTFWKPIERESYLQTEHYRGTIDRVDQLNKERECRIIEYKGNPGLFDEQELLFYANLFLEEYPLKKVSQLATYYYWSGELVIRAICEDDLIAFKEKLENIKMEMLTPNWKRTKNCHEQNIRCSFNVICQKIAIPRI